MCNLLWSGLHYERRKRLKLSTDGKDLPGTAPFSAQKCDTPRQNRVKNSATITDYSDPFAIKNLIDGLDCGQFGSVTKEIEGLVSRKMQVLSPYIVKYPTLSSMLFDLGRSKECTEAMKASQLVNNLIDLDDDSDSDVRTNNVEKSRLPIVIIDSDEEDNKVQRRIHPFQEVVLPRPLGQNFLKDIAVVVSSLYIYVTEAVFIEFKYLSEIEYYDMHIHVFTVKNKQPTSYVAYSFLLLLLLLR